MSGPKKRILIVEDQRLIAADLESTLAKIGYDVAGSVASGEEAIPKALEVAPDLVLMDIRLRGEMDGIQAAEAIRSRSDVPVVYLTAYADEETILRAKTTTPFGFVVKPFNERELRAAIEVAIYKHETDRLLAEERAGRRAAEEFKLLVDGVKDYAIVLLDAAGRFATWNEGARRIRGYSAEEILGKHFSVCYPPPPLDELAPEEVLARALRDGRVEVEGWRVRKDGTRFWASVIVTPVLDGDGKVYGFGEVTRDLTERKRQSELARLVDEATLVLASSLELSDVFAQAARLLVPALADGCILDLADENGRLTQAAVAHVDGEKEELAKELGRTLTPQPALGRGPLYAFLRGALDTNARDAASVALGPDHPELLRRLDVGAYVCVPIAFRGRTHGVLSVLRSTASPSFSDAERACAQELARRFGLAIDNARLYAQAKDAVRARDEFLQIASHELKTPLTPLLLQLDGLERSLERAGVRNERLTNKIMTATRQTTRLARLVESLLDVSRITAGRLLLDLEEVDLAEVTRSVAARFAGEATRAGSALGVHAEEPILGSWDRTRVEQIVSNLIVNAIKYGASKPITVEARVVDGLARISVTDHGIGIDRASLTRIFERFERAVSPRHYGGLGLGLYIARQFAEAHGGSIAVQSQLGAGSTFTVLLPTEVSSPRRPSQDARESMS